MSEHGSAIFEAANAFAEWVSKITLFCYLLCFVFTEKSQPGDSSVWHATPTQLPSLVLKCHKCCALIKSLHLPEQQPLFEIVLLLDFGIENNSLKGKWKLLCSALLLAKLSHGPMSFSRSRFNPVFAPLSHLAPLIRGPSHMLCLNIVIIKFTAWRRLL